MKFIVVVRVVITTLLIIAREILSQPPDSPVMAFFKTLGNEIATAVAEVMHPPSTVRM